MTFNIIAFCADNWNAFTGSLAFDPHLLQTPEMMTRLCLQAVFVLGAAFFPARKPPCFPSPSSTCRNSGSTGTRSQISCTPCWISPGG